MHSISRRLTRAAGIAGLVSISAVLAGCSTELASYDDTYVPASVEENFPIDVVERPVSVTLQATPSGLRPADVSEVARLGREVAETGTSLITIRYSSTHRPGQQAANQAAAILKRQGVPAHAILLAQGGKGDAVTLSFSKKTAETKPCGSWTENLRPNQFNESGTAFGCAVQQNIAAIVANSEDFEEARPMPASRNASQIPALKRYSDGTWTTPTADSDF